MGNESIKDGERNKEKVISTSSKKMGTGSKKQLKTVKDIPKGRLYHEPNDDVNKYYEITSELLGTGNFSVVKVGISRDTKERVAIKIVDKTHVKHKPEMLSNEVEILLRIEHPNIIKLIDLFDTSENLYLVMDLVTGGELFDRIVQREQYSEEDAKIVMRQLFDAIEYIHSQGVVHRDLKPENLLLEDKSTDTKIKLTDFGLSKIYNNDFLLKTACGTPGYVAPEILSSSGYGPGVDMWSSGVIMYILLCGYPPFYNENDAELFKSILNANYHFHSPYWDNISNEAKDVIRALLIKNPQKRLNATQAKEMSWFKTSSSKSKLSLPLEMKENLERHNTERKSMVHIQVAAKSKN